MNIAIPINQMAVFVVLTCLCFVFSRYRLGLALVFGFAFYWGYICNFGMFLKAGGGSEYQTILYVVLGLFLVFLALASFLAEAGSAWKNRKLGRSKH